MNKIIEIINGLSNLKSTEAVSEKEIRDAEKILGLQFADDYAEYLRTFGQINASGIELSGLSMKKMTSVIKMTNDERRLSSLPMDQYVIEDIGLDGLIYTQNSSGAIFEVLPNRQPRKVYDSLADYILNSIKS